MTKTEIDRRLALAIGYTADRVRVLTPRTFPAPVPFVQVLNDYSRGDGPMQYEGWQRFDHTEPELAWEVAKRFDAFPEKMYSRKDGRLSDYGARACSDTFTGALHSNPATTTALAVIQYCESKS